VVTEPSQSDPAHPAVILLNSGIIHRVGPNRLYVELARRLAGLGFLVLRFDLSGIGDSQPRQDNVPFAKSSIQETHDAMDYLATTHGASRFILGGICLGAVVSCQTALGDHRVVGTLLINGQGYIPESEQEVHAIIANRKNRRYYLTKALYSPHSWLAFVKGHADFRSLLRALKATRRPTRDSGGGKIGRVREEFEALADRGTSLLFLYSEGDQGIDELDLIMGSKLGGFRAQPNVVYRIVERSDHMFTALAKQQELLRASCEWIEVTARTFDRATRFSRGGDWQNAGGRIA
jgi:pimeloyl-ACP methyl ester carboxylesterase